MGTRLRDGTLSCFPELDGIMKISKRRRQSRRKPRHLKFMCILRLSIERYTDSRSTTDLYPNVVLQRLQNGRCIFGKIYGCANEVEITVLQSNQWAQTSNGLFRNHFFLVNCHKMKWRGKNCLWIESNTFRNTRLTRRSSRWIAVRS